ncbi:MAG: hypothetical protein L6R39_003953 [Caloplaca ligustica]|nr:MAG: hypothetical protein L6R39_003953 [Caloplaca ligustica]
MLAHSDSSNVARQPVRTSTLRQVTSTSEDLEAETPQSANRQDPLPARLRTPNQSLHGEIITLGVHDGPATGPYALLDPGLLPESAVDGKVLVRISPVDADLTTDGQAYGGVGNGPNGKTLGHEHIDATRGHLFIAEPMDSDMAGKSSGVQLSISSNEAARCGIRSQTRVSVSAVSRN